MPFKSEKQRRYLWAKHPKIAKKWADKYPNKDLPMYANEKADEKRAVLQVLNRVLTNSLHSPVNSIFSSPCDRKIKKADSKLEHVEMPQDEEPTYSGEKSINSILKPETEDEGSVGDVLAQEPQNPGKELLRKIALVASPELLREAERRKAQQQGAKPQSVPNNVNVKQYPAPSNIQPPMGSTAAPAPTPAPQQPAQPQGPEHGQLPPVGGGAAPNANPINSMGGLSTDPSQYGTPNAAFGTANAPGSVKQSNDDILGEIMSIDGSLDPTEQLELDEIWLDNLRAKCAAALKQQKCSCGCGQKVAECTCPASCSCRQKGGSCYGLKLEKAAAKPGLWANIHAKRKRGEKPAKPGEQDYPDSKSWTKTVKSSGLFDFLSPAPKPKAEPEPEPMSPEEIAETARMFDQMFKKRQKQVLVLDQPGPDARKTKGEKQAGSPAWQRSAGKNPEGGLNEKGRKSYERETGGNLKAPVTESNPSGERAKRQNSFCSRMCGMKRVNTGAKTKSDPDSRINKSLSKWNCKCGSALEFGIKLGQLLHWA
jgi:hypothetical protein